MKVTKKTKNSRFKRIVITGLALFTVALGLFTGYMIKSDQDAKKALADYETLITKSTLEDKNSGETNSIIELNQHTIVSAYYPQFNQPIDHDIKEVVATWMTEFKDFFKDAHADNPYMRSVLNIDYSSYEVNDRFVGLYFQIHTNSYVQAHGETQEVGYILDLEENRLLKASEYFKAGYAQSLARLVNDHYNQLEEYEDLVGLELYQRGIVGSIENYNEVVIKKDKVVVLFQRGQLFDLSEGPQSVEIEISELQSFLRYDTQGQEIVEVPLEDRKLVAFTFDDGPSSSITRRIVDAFKQVDGHATFFVVGDMVHRNGQELDYAVENGHEVGNHTYNHPDLTKLTPQQMLEEINSTNQAVASATGVRPTLVRAPYGAANNLVLNSINHPFINWNIDPEDWLLRDSELIVKNVLKDIRPNGIVIMHDIYETSAQAIETLLPILQGQGYEFVTVSELAAIQGITLESNNIYRFVE